MSGSHFPGETGDWRNEQRNGEMAGKPPAQRGGDLRRSRSFEERSF